MIITMCCASVKMIVCRQQWENNDKEGVVRSTEEQPESQTEMEYI